MITIAHDSTRGPISLQTISDKVSSHTPGILGEEHCKKYSILVPVIYTEQNKLAVLFEERAHTLRSQAGEICFPGGRWEPGDQTFWDTARRETSEELRIPTESITYIGELDTLVSHAQIMIYSYVGLLTPPEVIRPNPAEVERVFAIEVDHLLAMQPERHEVSMKPILAEDYPVHLIPEGENYRWREAKVPHYFYQYEGTVIWGMTAKILHHFLEIIRE